LSGQRPLSAAPLADAQQDLKPLESQGEQAEHHKEQGYPAQQNGQIDDGLHLGLLGAVDDGSSMHPAVTQ
jgi:hypothetical protein